MNRSRFRRRFGWALVGLSLALHFLTIVAFSRQPDIMAAYTVMPIWIWGGIGLCLSCSAFLFLRASLSLIVSGIWAVTILLGADEARVLAHFNKEAPQPGPAAPSRGASVMRVITLNCAHFEHGDPSEDLARWEPDVVLLQEVSPVQIKAIADTLYGGRGDYRFHKSSGIVTRWKIEREVRNPLYRDEQVTIRDPHGTDIEVVNLHLTSAATNLELWKSSAWHLHRDVRKERLQELSTALQLLEQTVPFQTRPILLGGDFNSPANDPVHSLLARDFTDAFEAAGTGWSNTFQRRVPILRLDCLYTTDQFIPVRARAVTTRNSDHRMVVADFILRGR
jgi:endonuclease/exonuclease/phosphatase (EEP) superfamily protein YafD